MRRAMRPASPEAMGPVVRTASWQDVAGGAAAVAAGALAGLAAPGAWPWPVVVGGAVLVLAVTAWVLPQLDVRAELRRLGALDEATVRFARDVRGDGVEAALHAAVSMLVPGGQLAALRLDGTTAPEEGAMGVVVADARATGRPAIVPDGTSGQEAGRLLALPIHAGDDPVGVAVVRLPRVRDVQQAMARLPQLLVRIAPALATAADRSGAHTTQAEPSEQAEERADEEDLRALVARGAHDLRTPLNTLAGMVDTLVRLGDELTPPQRAELYAALQRSTRRVAGWITALLDSAVEPVPPGSRVVETAPLQPLLEEAATVSQAATAGLQVETVPTDLLVQVDPGAVVRVVSNLLANAGHHARTGPVEVEVQPRGRWVEVCVRDHGDGWGKDSSSAEDEASDTGSHHAGLGLGLGSVRTQVSGWGGRLTLDETPGGGATVRFTVPGAVVPEVDDEDAREGRALQWTIAGSEPCVQDARRPR